MQGATTTVLVATRAQLEHRIAVLQSELGARPELVHRAAPHPHPRVRSGVFTKTMTELAGAIHALAGAGDCLWAAGELRSAGGAEVIAGVPVRNAANWCYDAGAAARARWDAVDWSGAEVGPVAVVAALQGN